MSDTQSAPCGVGGFGFVPIAIDHPKIPDELRGDVARLLDKLGIANAYIDALEARVAELEARCRRLEEAGDAMADWNMNERNLGCDPELADAWRQAKEAKP